MHGDRESVPGISSSQVREKQTSGLRLMILAKKFPLAKRGEILPGQKQ